MDSARRDPPTGTWSAAPAVSRPSRNPSRRVLRFVDLFSGLGGFHIALSRLGHRCVFACELDPDLRHAYAKNHALTPQGDIRDIQLDDVPAHDILCAGFPCQPFSKAGMQLGTDCPEYGDLLATIVEWLRAAKPTYFILENVPNFLRHRSGMVWRHFGTELRQAGYDVRHTLLSPHQFGVPQLRERLYVVGSRQGLSDFKWPVPTSEPTDIRSILETPPVDAKPLPSKALVAIEAWARFTELFPRTQPKPSFPIWAAEFGASYPYSTTTPWGLSTSALQQFAGSFGQPLKGLKGRNLFAALPPYSRTKCSQFPEWKTRFIQQNRELYERNRGWIDRWKSEIVELEPSYQKLEWNFDRSTHSLWQSVLQLRGSGIRAKSPRSAPALVAMSSSQVPVIAWEGRFLTIRECARLQGMADLQHWPASESAAIRALGNAVNVKVTELIARALLEPNAQGLAGSRRSTRSRLSRRTGRSTKV
jgi:DNA (cytosine-5)-methyltransferase 1